MLAIEECQLDFVEFGGLDFLVPLLTSTELEIQKSALRAISNLSIYYGMYVCVLFLVSHVWNSQDDGFT